MTRSVHLFAAAAALALGASLAAQSVPEIAYDANADLLKLPDNIHLGEAAGVATNSKGHIFVYTRTGASHATVGTSRTFYKAGSRLFEFDQTGKFVREIGVGVYGFNNAQAVRVDPQDNIWVVDQGSTQVIKFDPDGRIQLVLSRKPEAIAVRAGAPGEARRRAPKDAVVRRRKAVASARRRLRAAPRRRRRRAAAGAVRPDRRAPAFPATTSTARPASRGTRRATSTSPTAWATASATRASRSSTRTRTSSSRGASAAPSRGSSTRCAASRSTPRGSSTSPTAATSGSRCSTPTATSKAQIAGVGVPAAICITPGAHQYMYVSNSNDAESLDNGEIYKMELDGKIVGKFGRAGRLPKEFNMVNAIDCRSENELFVGELGNWRVQKLTLHPAK